MPAKAPILIVDDDPDIREALLDTFHDEGHPAVALPDGPAALHYLRHQPKPCLMLLDWNMAPMNGGQVLAHMLAQPALAAVPVVLVTADMHAETKATTPGFVALLKKPVDVRALFDLVDAHCAS